tara:strand:- start:2782 stop:3660 length:879 start_codon:yes stop_codon:yes gene_type:complete
MKIGLIGLGYWGKIILKNLEQLGYKDITVCESKDVDWSQIGSKYKLCKDYKKLKCDKVFVLTPATSHFDICSFFLQKGIDVFCEKPLDVDSKNCEKLFNLAEKNGSYLFVDWLFTFNPAVKEIKNLIQKEGKPKNILANRMNFGPVRSDVNARWDLASHDVSIAHYLLEEQPKEVSWIDFKRDPDSLQEDSVVGVLSFEHTCVQINASWSYGKKDRQNIMEFDRGILEWHDNLNSLKYIDKTIEIPAVSPLHCSINSFFDKNVEQRDLTLNITKSLNRESLLQQSKCSMGTH